MSTQPFLVGMEGEQRRLDLSQWYTPAWLAIRLVRWAELRPADRVLEPAAGRGALLAPMLRAEKRAIVAYELDPGNVLALQALATRHNAAAGWCFEVRGQDFTAQHESDVGSFDVCVMNPPYEDGQDCAFVERALLCAPRVVGVFRAAILHADERRDFWTRVRPTRIAHLLKRPQFGQGEKSTSAQSDFVALELRARVHAGCEPIRCAVEFW